MPGEPPRVQPSKKVAAHWDEPDDGTGRDRMTGCGPRAPVRAGDRPTRAALFARYLDFYRET